MDIDNLIQEWESKHTQLLSDYNQGNWYSKVLEMYRDQMKMCRDVIDQLKSIEKLLPKKQSNIHVCPKCGIVPAKEGGCINHLDCPMKEKSFVELLKEGYISPKFTLPDNATEVEIITTGGRKGVARFESFLDNNIWELQYGADLEDGEEIIGWKTLI